MATAHAARCMMAAINLTFDDHGFLFTDDQFVFANTFLDSLKTSHPIITLDYYDSVFGSLYDNLQGDFYHFTPHDWECVEGKGWMFKLTGGVPKIYHASGNQGQLWMQRDLYPYSLRSAVLGYPAPCDPAKAEALVQQKKQQAEQQAQQPQQQEAEQAQQGTQDAATAATAAAPADGREQEHLLDAHAAEHSLHIFAVPHGQYSTDTLLEFLIVAVCMLILCATLAIMRQRMAAASSRKQYVLPSTNDASVIFVDHKSS
jgi:hypothetical protein